MILWLRNLRVTTRIMLLAFFQLLMMVAALAYLLLQLEAISLGSLLQQDKVAEQNQWINKKADLIDSQANTQTYLQKSQRIQKTYSDMLFWYFDGTITQFYESLNNASTTAVQLEQQLIELALEPHAAKHINQVLENLHEYRKLMGRAIQYYQQDKTNLANTEISDAHLLVKDMNEQLLEITNLFQGQLNDANSQVQEALDKTLDASRVVEEYSLQSSERILDIKMGTGLILAITVPISILVAVLIILSITRPLKVLKEKLLSIEKHSDLTQKLPMGGQDEIREMSAAIDKLLSKLRDTLTGVGKMSNQLKTTADNGYQISLQTHKQSTEQQHQSEGIASAATELEASAMDISRTTDQGLKLVEAASTAAKTGQEDVQATARTIEKLAIQFKQVEKTVQDLARHSVTISTVLDVIKSIAEQTNLLALNAAIEAARAGDQGRGFAVVADEVRTLALRTSQSTNEIQEMVEALQRQSREAIESLETNRFQVNAGVQLSSQAEDSLHRIQNEMQALSTLNQSIAIITNEQQQAVLSVDKSVQEVRQLACHVESHAADSHAINEQLHTMAKQLQQQLLSFRH